MADSHGTPKHPYHLVDPSPWPVVGSLSAFIMALGAIGWMHHMFSAAPIVFGAGTVGVLVGLDNISPSNVTVTIAGRTITFVPGETTRSFTTNLVNNSIPELTRTLGLTITGTVNAVIGTPATHLMTILDDDGADDLVVDGLAFVVQVVARERRQARERHGVHVGGQGGFLLGRGGAGERETEDQSRKQGGTHGLCLFQRCQRFVWKTTSPPLIVVVTCSSARLSVSGSPSRITTSPYLPASSVPISA